MNFPISAALLVAGTGCTGKAAALWLPHIQVACDRFEINTRLRVCAFLAQIGHESGHLVYTKELGSDTYLAKYDTGRLAAKLGNTPEADGDGQKYRGYGLIQITGLYNVMRCSLALFGDDRLVKTPELLQLMPAAALSAAWYWASKGLNKLADGDQFTLITEKINGGRNGLAERKSLYRAALKAVV